MSTAEDQFEPKSVGMVLDRSFRLYSENFPLMLGITAVLNAPIFLVAAAPLLLPLITKFPFLVAIVGLSSAVIGLLTLLLVYPLVTGATTKAVSDKYLGKPVTVGSALKEAWDNVGTLLLTQIVVGAMVLVGFLLLFVPGILWLLSYSLVPPVIMIEASDRKMSRQLYSLTGEARKGTPVLMDRADIRRRSWELVRGNRGRVFVILLVFFIMRTLLSSGSAWLVTISFAANSTSGLAVQSIMAQAINIFVGPLQTIAITLLYYDFRIRKEGFDLEMLSEAMGNPSVNA